ncbi:MAG: tetratricopeptide repeat protein, partial [Verrucomicrobiota bacterium]
MPPFVHRLRLRSKRSSRRPAAKAPHGLPGRSDRLRRLGLPALLALALLPLASAQETVTTLRETLARGQAALADGDYDGAYEAFEAIQETFGEEPEVRTESFRLTVLPVHGYAALLGGHPEAAVGLFEDFIDSFPEDRSRQGFVLFNLARAQSELGRNDEAIETYRAFVALDPDRPEAALSTLEAVRLMFKSDREDEAFDALDSLYARQPPGVLRTKARLTALQEALERGRVEQARDYMLESDWEVSEMPELAVLAFAALEMGNELLAARAYPDALRCYRLVPPFESLLEAQARRLAETRARFEERRDRVGLYQGGQFWTRFYSRLIARLEAQMKGLQEAEDYTPALYLSYGQAYLLDGRPREAWILFEYFARDPDLPKERQAEAHYRWILAAVEVGVWEDAFRIAEGFGERFPESPLVPDALFLLANAYQEAGQYADAIEVLTHFLANHDEHRLAPRARFVRGYNHNLMNQPVEAREDFDR